jgi:hypothetical protein
MAALPNTGITTSMVAQAIGVGSNDVGTLCKSNKINKWSAGKPKSLLVPSTAANNTYTGPTPSGLYRANNPYDIVYGKPTGGANDPYRLGDFRGYNHIAKPPVKVVITKVNGLGGDQTTPPFTLMVGNQYTISFYFELGEVDPVDIHPHTVKTKNTAALGGYGGVSWVGFLNPTYEMPVEANKVFSAAPLPINDPPLTQSVLIGGEAGTGTPTLEMFYVRYNGDADGGYTTVPFSIEDPDYRNNIQVISMDVDTAFIEITVLLNDITARTTTANNMTIAVNNIRLRFSYNYQLGSEYPDPLPPGTPRIETIRDIGTINAESSVNTFSILQKPPAVHGTYQYFGFIYTEQQQPNGTWVGLHQTQFNTSVTF